jgi:hypothetical protein
MRQEITVRATIDADGPHCRRACQYCRPFGVGTKCNLFLDFLLIDGDDGRHLRCAGCLCAAGAERSGE